MYVSAVEGCPRGLTTGWTPDKSAWCERHKGMARNTRVAQCIRGGAYWMPGHHESGLASQVVCTGFPRGVCPRQHPWGKRLHIKCFSPLRACKTLEANMEPYGNSRDESPFSPVVVQPLGARCGCRGEGRVAPRLGHPRRRVLSVRRSMTLLGDARINLHACCGVSNAPPVQRTTDGQSASLRLLHPPEGQRARAAPTSASVGPRADQSATGVRGDAEERYGPLSRVCGERRGKP
jgi:hypothetical protein